MAVASQVPSLYDQTYRYAAVGHTNWNKNPVVMPATRAPLSIFMDADTLDHFSLRTYFLRKFKVLEYVLPGPLLLTVVSLMKQVKRQS